MAATIIGHAEPFQLGVEDWDQHTEQLEQYFIANENGKESGCVADHGWSKDILVVEI